jgi:transcriptional regulator with XRE-family HTH domain
MDELSFEIGKNIRKYRKLKGLTLEKLAEVLETETNYLGQCERGERRFSLDKLVDIMEYFGVTANDIISLPNIHEIKSKEKSLYLQEINAVLDNCTDNQLAVLLNVIKETVPFLKD